MEDSARQRIVGRGDAALDPNDIRLIFSDEPRHAVEVDDRRAERDLVERAASLATFVGVLGDLRDRSVALAVTTAWGRRHRGVVADIGIDHVVLDRSGGAVAIVIDEIATVMPDPDVVMGPGDGDLPHSSDATLMERLDRWREGRQEVGIVSRGSGQPLRGSLVVVGDDVVTLSRESSQARIHVPARAIVEVHVAAWALR